MVLVQMDKSLKLDKKLHSLIKTKEKNLLTYPSEEKYFNLVIEPFHVNVHRTVPFVKRNL
jgi:hypothetical protein